MLPTAVIISAFLAVAATASPLAQLSAAERADLSAELTKWKLSEAGKHAVANGFVPKSSGVKLSLTAHTDDELERYLNTKKVIEQLHKEHPGATFSTNSPFTLMTEAEFATYVKSSSKMPRRLGASASAVAGEHRDLSEQEAMADSKDWTTGKCVAPIQDQGACGSCWAFSTVAAAESANCLATGTLTKFSEQQVTSCSTNGGSQGCDGGWPDKATDWVISNGLCTLSSYPYTSGTTQQTGTCKTSCSAQKLQLRRTVRVASGEGNLQTAIDAQPTVVVVSAGNNVWKQYSGGVVSCTQQAQSDHAVVAVGYGGSGSGAYFKIRNSWSSSWGDAGHILLRRGVGSGGTCNVATAPVYPEYISGGPTPAPGPTSPTTTPRPTTTTPAPTTASPGTCGCTRGSACYGGDCLGCNSPSGYCYDLDQDLCSWLGSGYSWCGF